MTPFLFLLTAIYQVADLDAAKSWYSKAFNTEPYFDEPFYVGFSIHGYELGLLPDKTAGQKLPSVLTYWGVENIQQEYDRLISLGATSHEAPNNVGGELMVATLFDPWQNIVGLIYNPDFKIS